MRPAWHWRTASALAAATLVVASCTPGNDGDAPGTSRPAVPRGRITVVVVGDPMTLDPYGRRATALTAALARPVYRSLYRLAPDGEPVPDLVAELETSDGRAEVTLVAGRLGARDVAASARRARRPSGLSGLRVKVLGPRRVVLRGDVADWPARLAVATWVLPRGTATGSGGGPYRITSHRRGYEILLGARPGADPPPRAARIRVLVAADSAVALSLLEAGRADVGWIPSTVNLDERAAAANLEYIGTLGWETVALDFSGTALSIPERRWIAATVGRSSLAAGFVRGAGEVASAPVPGSPGAPPASVVVTAPAEDELLGLVLRALQRRLAEAGTAAEAVLVPAGERPPRGVVRVVRSPGAPGLEAPGFPAAWPLFRVESVLVRRDGVVGPASNPTIDGPLWNVESWRVRGRI